MKKRSFTLFAFLCISILVFSQKVEEYVGLQPVEFTDADLKLLSGYPELVMPEPCRNRQIPYRVNHSETPYFRTPFPQEGLSCGQASSTGMCFTYEMCAARDLPANINANLYPTHFVYNWEALGGGGAYYQTLEILKRVGTPNQEEYGGTPYYGGNYRWITGYDMYYSAMHNRLDKVYKLNISTAEGMQVLKNWMYDRFDGRTPGGCAITYSQNRTPSQTLPAGTEDAGMYVLTSGYVGSSHSFTFLGYNDSIRYDYNGDGRYTNDIDINGDGVVDMRDWEIGGLIMCETYFGATAWANGGYCYVMYKAIADGFIYEDVVHVMEVNPTYEPLLTAKVSLTHDKRGKLKIFAGISSDPLSSVPEHIIDFPIFNYQGGDYNMQGGASESDKTIEFGLDLTPLINYVPANTNVKYFLMVSENDLSSIGSGTINNFSIINYSGGEAVELICNQTNVNIENNTTTTLSITGLSSSQNVNIATEFLSPGAIMSTYSFQMEADNGTLPYEWSFDTDYIMTGSTGDFPAGGTTVNTGEAIDLGFTINYYGEEVNVIYPSKNGVISFDNYVIYSYPWSKTCKELLVFMNNKIIVPFYVQNHTATSMKKIVESNYVTIIWESSLIDYAVTIHRNGEINIIYNDSNMVHSTSYIAGLSNGDGERFSRIIFPDHTNVRNGVSYSFVSNPVPEDFEISKSGLLTGIPSRDYYSELLHFKVRDNNGLVDRISLPFVTDGLIVTYNTSTQDGDDIIEYGEDVDVEVSLTNPMASVVSDIIITASCSSPYITFINNTINCASLLSGQTLTLQDRISFSVSNEVPNTYPFTITFSVESNGENWMYNKIYNAYSPIFELNQFAINDGNDNQLTRGENAEVTVTIKNLGIADARNITMRVRSEDPNITLTNNITAIPVNLAPNNYVDFNFDLAVNSIIEDTYSTIICVDLYSADLLCQTMYFEIGIHTEDITVIDIFNMENINIGEQRNMVLQLKNIGIINVEDLTVRLEVYSPYAEVNTESRFVESMFCNSSAFVDFNVNISENCPDDEIIVMKVIMTTETGYRKEELLCLRIGIGVTLGIDISLGILVEDFETGAISDIFEWQHSGAASWYVVSDNPYEGNYCLRSGIIGDNQESVISIDIVITNQDTMSFAYKASSEATYDELIFYINNVEYLRSSGITGWNVFTKILIPGSYNLKWEYVKDNSISRNEDAVWIDYIHLPILPFQASVFSSNTNIISKIMDTGQESTESFRVSNIGNISADYDVNIRNIVANNMAKNIQGSNLTTNFHNFIPGETYDITFFLNTISPDNENIRLLRMEFPDEIVVNSSTDIVGSNGTLYSNNAVGQGAGLFWYSVSDSEHITSGENVEFTVNVSFSSAYSGEISLITYNITGNNTGAAPHEISSDITLYNQNMYWLNIDERIGIIGVNESNNFQLTFNTENMARGTYYAEIIISGSVNTIIIPVELSVEDYVNNPIFDITSNLQCFPNPFKNSVSIVFNNSGEELLSIKMLDITGKEIKILENNRKALAESSVFTYKIENSLPAGIYFLRVETNNKTEVIKLIKE
ncbi:MAG: T9SS type A sorting domain-containing protein [Bacteroidales bacterium]|jgi:hypothetical protein|nr:T9SS type A sorting domain-containing protein [Bacteroidales bacterium]